MKKLSLEDIFGAIGIVVGFIFILYVFFSKDYIERGGAAVKDLGIFVLLLSIVIGFALFARKQINISNAKRDEVIKKEKEREEKEAEEKKKEEQSSFVENDIKHIGNIAVGLFHFLPLYFTLFLIKIDLHIAYKFVLFALAISVYIMIELNYLYSKVFDLFLAIKIKFRIKNFFVIGALLILSAIALLIITIYFAYNLIIFYVEKFPN